MPSTRPGDRPAVGDEIGTGTVGEERGTHTGGRPVLQAPLRCDGRTTLPRRGGPEPSLERAEPNIAPDQEPLGSQTSTVSGAGFGSKRVNATGPRATGRAACARYALQVASRRCASARSRAKK